MASRNVSARSPDEARLARAATAAVLLFFLANAILRTGYAHFGGYATGTTRPMLDTLLSELSSATAMAVAFFLVVLPISRRWPLRGARWPRHLAIHAAGLVSFSAVKTLLMWAQRVPLWRVSGLGRYDYGDLEFRIPMEFSSDVLGYAFLVAAVHAWYGWQELQDRRVRQAQLESRLGQARLTALHAQLQPHFLFNTLNAISAVMYRDPRLADRLLSRLSDLLRSSLSSGDPVVSIAEEVDLLQRYLEIESARFGERLRVRLELDPNARNASVPRLFLQPIVENAIRHTVAARAGPGSVWVRVRRAGGRLRITVDDDGVGFPGDPASVVGEGIGLANTRERLAELYGDGASLSLSQRAPRGARVAVDIPFLATAGRGPDD